jgi:hypothetical protein
MQAEAAWCVAMRRRHLVPSIRDCQMQSVCLREEKYLDNEWRGILIQKLRRPQFSLDVAFACVAVQTHPTLHSRTAVKVSQPR